MKVLVCIDDTDNLESIGTGDLATAISEKVINSGWGDCSPVSRHQLYVHPDIPYTSHNSSMCFAANINDNCLEQLIAFASTYLKETSAQGSDPGLCVACVEQITNPQELMAFGNRAKTQVLTKEEAFIVAREQGVHLSEHGGTGQGIIGALAGVGLRLGGKDGRLKGKLKIRCENNIATVKQIKEQTKIQEVRSLDGQILDNDESVVLGDWVKAILQDGLFVLPVFKTEEADKITWFTCTKQQLRDY